MNIHLRNQTLDGDLAEARKRYAERRPQSLAMHTAATKFMPGGNTRTVLYHGPFPLRVAAGAGSRITDVDGISYVNMLGEYTAGLFGHSHPVIRAAINEALDGGVNLGAHNKPEMELARLVTERFPAIEKVRFTNSGTEANLMAVATARFVTRRSKVMVFKGGYHGGLLYFGGGGIPINTPYEFVVARYNDIESATALIRATTDDLACVIVEPMLGSSGCIPAGPDFLRALRAETERTGALLIFDEVMTSRFGRGGAHQLLGMAPDLVTLGKWVGGGMSFGAFGGRADIMDIYDPAKAGAMPHAGTFNNNVLSMRAGVAALAEVFRPEAAQALHAKGEALRKRLNRIFTASGFALQVTGQGSLMNIHPVAGHVSNVDDLAFGDDRVKELLFLDLLEHGYYMARRGFIALSIVLDDSEIDSFADAIEEIIAARAAAFAAAATEGRTGGL